MHYVALHQWSKFKTNFTTFQWVTSKKPPRSSLKLYFLLVLKHLKFQNSRTTNNQTYMKLGLYLYHLNTFNIPNNEGVNEWAGGGAIKTTRKCHEIKRISTLTSSKTILENAKDGDFFTAIHNHQTLALM